MIVVLEPEFSLVCIYFILWSSHQIQYWSAMCSSQFTGLFVASHRSETFYVIYSVHEEAALLQVCQLSQTGWMDIFEQGAGFAGVSYIITLV